MIKPIDASALRKIFELRNKNSKLFPDEVVKKVKGIIADVESRKDEAIREYSQKFEGTPINLEIKVCEDDLKKWASEVGTDELEALKAAIKNIRSFHINQLSKSWQMETEGGSILGNIVTPIQSVGVYVPGGTASYPSSVIMNIVPAQIAGVERIVIFTPAKRDGSINKYVAAAACELGVYDVFRIGGAQAVAAAAFGTETVPKVDKLVGPGNIYVAAAKREVYGLIDIDMIAGPSEIVVIADKTGRADFVASDMLSQAEHDVMSKAILITDSKELAKAVSVELERQLKRIEREKIARTSLETNGAICIVGDISQGIELANYIAPEHIELILENPMDYLKEVKNAGAIFIGEYSTESIGDYIAGPNHVLPTNGTARFSSPLSVKDFQKMSSLICYSKEDYLKYAPSAIKIAEAEGLNGHANALKVRL